MKQLLILSCLIAFAVAQPPSATAQADARARGASANNLKAIGLASHNHESAHESFPGDIKDQTGKPLLSWRVAILPYLDHDALYKQFKLDEPWDSENNKPLLEKMPKIFTVPGGKVEEGNTFYQCFAGNGAFLVDNPRKILSITDGLSNTFMVAEAGEAVPWTKPADMAFDPEKPLPKLGGLFNGDFHVLMCDGSVRFVKKDAKEENLKKFITVAGGEVTEEKDLE